MDLVRVQSNLTIESKDVKLFEFVYLIFWRESLIITNVKKKKLVIGTYAMIQALQEEN